MRLLKIELEFIDNEHLMLHISEKFDPIEKLQELESQITLFKKKENNKDKVLA